MTTADYSFLDDPAERDWLTKLDPADIVSNAHRFYDFMHDQGLPAESFLRELAFTKAAEALGLDYEVLYQAWLNETAVPGQD